MPTDFRLHIDPADVLGVPRDASLGDIREAYRAKAKRYHPDAGGEEWAFRLLAQAYEILSTARVANRADRFEAATAAAAAAGPVPHRPAQAAPGTPPPFSAATPPPRRSAAWPFPNDPPSAPNRPRTDTHESVRPGVQEPAMDPAQVVDVEKVTIRYEAEHVWLITDRGRQDRLLSCSLNLTWPDPESAIAPATVPNAEAVLQGLDEVFAALRAESRATSANSSVLDGRFTGWLSFPDDEQAAAAFGMLRERLHGVGLVVKQWSRDLVIPRQWR